MYHSAEMKRTIDAEVAKRCRLLNPSSCLGQRGVKERKMDIYSQFIQRLSKLKKGQNLIIYTPKGFYELKVTDTNKQLTNGVEIKFMFIDEAEVVK